MKSFSTKTLAKVAILGALSTILFFFDFPLPFIPSFYKLDFSEVAVLVGGFALGPIPAVIIEAMKVILNVLFTGSNTAYVGETAAFIMGCAFCVPPAIIYKRNKTKSSAIKGLAAGVASLAIVGIVINYFVLLPAYSYFYQMPMDTIVGIGSALIPLIHDKLTFVLFATLPFNLIKGVVISVVTMLLYKHISPILHR